MYIVSVFIANINTLSNNHEKVNKSSQIFLPVLTSSKSFSYNGCIYGLLIMAWKRVSRWRVL